ncbi:response regulator transcription factor [Lacihabitans sp. CS3-21]|jgi:DNA-binding NarL/FixJ family response regulator|uniref:response regulator transcription factor n=1 Tax=Lacihabitans sp. CS3-21 TaxID=2487332 RepID=UPI000BD5B65B|nr:response regulator transcription factor [Lacihabitans sp. CS3-21]MCP9748875.1 DNA-binding response regulator [Lacihabitans sp. CS3-21]MDP1813502.1 response regulator transcription factor [Leadbetterella sp.]OYU65480.1 MAG: DNA-binding response regulator [Cytophagaceae bacterium BCCC1]
MIRVNIYEDQSEIRELLIETVRSSSDLLLVNAYPNAKEILENTRKDKPEVLLMDIQMPGISGIEAVQLVKRQYPQIQICMQTVFEDNEKIFAAICSGASGYILKDSSPEKYINAIIDTYQGGSPMTPSIARKVLTMFQNQNTKVTDFAELTTGEKNVLELLVKGLSYKMIAADLGVSFPTVNFHLKNIYKKLHVNSATEAISKALVNNLV